MTYLSPFFFLGQTHGFTTIFSGLDDYYKFKIKKKKKLCLSDELIVLLLLQIDNKAELSFFN